MGVEGSSGVGETNFSEASNGSALHSEGLAPRKKANRVSFDETNVVVGQAATPIDTDSPVVLSPQTKSKWFSIGRGKKKEIRKSMRGPGSMRGSLRTEAEPKGSLQKKYRPMSYPAEVQADHAEVKKHVRNLSAASA